MNKIKILRFRYCAHIPPKEFMHLQQTNYSGAVSFGKNLIITEEIPKPISAQAAASIAPLIPTKAKAKVIKFDALKLCIIF